MAHEEVKLMRKGCSIKRPGHGRIVRHCAPTSYMRQDPQAERNAYKQHSISSFVVILHPFVVVLNLFTSVVCLFEVILLPFYVFCISLHLFCSLWSFCISYICFVCCIVILHPFIVTLHFSTLDLCLVVVILYVSLYICFVCCVVILHPFMVILHLFRLRFVSF